MVNGSTPIDKETFAAAKMFCHQSMCEYMALLNENDQTFVVSIFICARILRARFILLEINVFELWSGTANNYNIPITTNNLCSSPTILKLFHHVPVVIFTDTRYNPNIKQRRFIDMLLETIFNTQSQSTICHLVLTTKILTYFGREIQFKFKRIRILSAHKFLERKFSRLHHIMDPIYAQAFVLAVVTEASLFEKHLFWNVDASSRLLGSILSRGKIQHLRQICHQNQLLGRRQILNIDNVTCFIDAATQLLNFEQSYAWFARNSMTAIKILVFTLPPKSNLRKVDLKTWVRFIRQTEFRMVLFTADNLSDLARHTNQQYYKRSQLNVAIKMKHACDTVEEAWNMVCQVREFKQKVSVLVSGNKELCGNFVRFFEN